MKYFLILLTIVFYSFLFYYSSFFLKNDTFFVVDNFINSVYFNLKSPYVNDNVKEDLKNIVFVWIDDNFFSKFHKTPFDLDNMDYFSFIDKINKLNPNYILFDWNSLNLVWNKYINFLWINSLYYKNYMLDSFSSIKNLFLSDNLKNKLLLGYDDYSYYLKQYFWKKWLSTWTIKLSKWKNWITKWISIFYNNFFQIPLWYMLYLKENNIKNYKLEKKDWFLNIYKNWWNLIKQIPVTQDNNILISPLVSFSKIKYYSIIDIMKNKQKDFLKDKIVFLWVNSKLYRKFRTYAWNSSSLVYQLNLYLSLKKDIFYRSLSKKVILYFIYFVLILSFIALIKSHIYSMSILFWSIFLSIYIYYLLLSQLWIFINLWTLVVIFLIILSVNFVLWLLNSYIKRKQITKLFDQYVWKEVLEKKEDELSSNNKKISEQKKAFILFTDIVWFTSISEKLKPQQVIDMLNIYFKYMNQEIEKSWWFIDKYVWDAVIAFWEDKKYSDNILKVILNMKNLHKKINEEIHDKILSDININTRFWVHYWDVIVWDIWDKFWKISYTIIWDNVNLASRLEWINKYYWTNIIISETILPTIKYSTWFYYRLLDKITVKWKKEWIKIYELISSRNKFDNLEYIKYIRKFENWILYYLSWNFNSSFTIFTELKQEKFAKDDNALSIMYKRVKKLKENPPENWDGIWKYNMK